MHIAHRNLKLDNILVNIAEMKVMNKIVLQTVMKVIDFRKYRIEVGSNPKVIENNYIYDSSAYMALEVLKNKKK